MKFTKRHFSKDIENLRIALVYDWLDSQGGAERVLHVLAKLFPHADWYTSIVDAHHKAEFSPETSFLQKIPYFNSHRTLALPLYPLAFESFNFTGYDLVISITSSFAKGIITKPETRHLCYMLTPTRFLWVTPDEYLSRPMQALIKPYITYLKKWDLQAAKRPDRFIAISQTVSERIRMFYEESSDIVYPPFDYIYWERHLRSASFKRFSLPEGYYLIVSRLKKYKKVDLAIQAFNKISQSHLVIVGEGPEKAYLQSIAAGNIHFLGAVTDNELAYLYSHAKGFIMPQEEDFGYTSLEAQVCSCPVIAYNKGGATETVQHLKTGYLFPEQTPESLLEALENFSQHVYTIDHYLQLHGSDYIKQFSEDVFKKSFMNIIQSTS